MTSTEEIVSAGNDEYKENHLAAMFRDGFSFSGYERDGLYLNVPSESGSRKYFNVSSVSGIDSPSDGRASVFADFDDDGDLDLFVTTIQGEAHLLFRNEVGQSRGFLRVALRGTDAGPDAYGAVVRVKTSRGIQTKVKSGGQGYLSQHDPRLLFGLGTDGAAEWLEVTWPNGSAERFGGPDGFASGSSWLIVQGEGAPREVRERPTRLPDPLGRDAALLAGLGLSIGGELPSFPVTGRDGRSGDIREMLQPGRTALVNVWATWCVPCATEMPELQRKYASFREAGVDLIGVNIDSGRSADRIEPFLSGKGIAYPIALGGEAAMKAIYGDGEVFVPLTFIVGGDGRIRTAFGGWSAEAQRKLNELLGG